MANTISNMDDTIDSRDVIERIEELQTERDTFCESYETSADMEEADEETTDKACAAWADANSEEAAELAALEALQEEAEGYCPDWTYGAQLIRDSYFEDYAQETAEDCGMIQPGATWPNNCIDWEQAARELQQDYTAVDFDGVTYWVR